jgi:hypothetical protein
VLQDFLGATERVDILTEMQHLPDVELRQSVQVRALTYKYTICLYPLFFACKDWVPHVREVVCIADAATEMQHLPDVELRQSVQVTTRVRYPRAPEHWVSHTSSFCA